MRKPFVLLCFLFALPALAGSSTTISSMGDCTPVGGAGRWSNPANWVPMQVPDNGRPPGTTYDVVVPGNCLGMLLDTSVTINSLNMWGGFWDGSKQKPLKIHADSTSLTVINDCRIDDLGLTNGKLTVGGRTWMNNSAGWVLRDSKVKTRDYFQDFFTQASFSRSTLEVAGRFTSADFAWTLLSQSTLETQDLDLMGALSLDHGAVVKVKGDFKADDHAAISILLNASTDFTVNGNAWLAGGLGGRFTAGYVPAPGQEFTILRAKGAITGSWSNIFLPQLPAGMAWQLVVAPRVAYLKVIAAP